MKAISWIISILLISILLSAGISYYVDKKILRADYLDEKLYESGVYNDLAKNIPANIVSDADLPAKEATKFKTEIAKLSTPEFLRSTVHDYLIKLEAYLRGNGPAVEFNLTEILQNQASANNIQIPAEQLNANFNFVNEPLAEMKENGQNLQRTKMIISVVSIVLLIILLILSIVSRRFGALIFLFFASAIINGLLAIFSLKFVPKLVENLKAKINMELSLDSFEKMINSIAQDFGNWFYKLAIGYIVLAIIFIIVGLLLKKRFNSSKNIATHPVGQ